MTEFEFVQVTVAIILGLGLTELLRNIGEQIRHRLTIEIYPLQVFASCLLLFVILSYLWSFWALLEITWTYPLFLLNILPSIALALSTQVIRVDSKSERSSRDQYFANCRAIYLIWALAPLIGIIFEATTQSMGLVPMVARLLVVILLSSLAFIKQPAYHWSVLSVLFATLIIGPTVYLFRLGT